MKCHQIQGIEVCTSCWRPDEAHARLVAGPCIASTAPAVSQTNDTHSWLSHIKPSLCAQAVLVGKRSILPGVQAGNIYSYEFMFNVSCQQPPI